MKSKKKKNHLGDTAAFQAKWFKATHFLIIVQPHLIFIFWQPPFSQWESSVDPPKRRSQGFSLRYDTGNRITSSALNSSSLPTFLSFPSSLLLSLSLFLVLILNFRLLTYGPLPLQHAQMQDLGQRQFRDLKSEPPHMPPLLRARTVLCDLYFVLVPTSWIPRCLVDKTLTLLWQNELVYYLYVLNLVRDSPKAHSQVNKVMFEDGVWNSIFIHFNGLQVNCIFDFILWHKSIGIQCKCSSFISELMFCPPLPYVSNAFWYISK